MEDETLKALYRRNRDDSKTKSQRQRRGRDERDSEKEKMWGGKAESGREVRCDLGESTGGL